MSPAARAPVTMLGVIESWEVGGGSFRAGAAVAEDSGGE